MMKFFNVISNNFLAKIISLSLAIATWFYVFDIVSRETGAQKKENIEKIYSKIDFTFKKVPIKPMFNGKPPSGFRIAQSKVEVTPREIYICGPRAELQMITEIPTVNIDVRRRLRSINLTVNLNPGSKLIKMENTAVNVYLAIESAPR